MSKNDIFEVKDPCSESWDEMTGNDEVRFCSHCAKSVNNISTMTRKEARKLVLRSNGTICLHYIQNPRKGGPLFAPQLVKIARRTGLAAGVLGASIAAAQPVFAQGSPQPVSVIRADQIPVSDGSPAKMSGTVYDQAGAVIQFAFVSIINKENGDYRSVSTNAEGVYEFTDLPAGKYSLKIDAAGFQTYELKEFTVGDGDQTRRNATMEIPQVAEVVQVSGKENSESWGGIDGVVVSIVNSNALVRAVMNDDLEEVKVRVLMNERINVRDKSYDGISPLHAAVENGNIDIARFLLERGAKTNIRDFQKRTPIMMLDEEATPEMVQLLITFGAKLKLRDKEGNYTLHHAVENGVEPDVLSALINYGVNIDAVNKEGKTALIVAAEEEENELITTLLQSGANVSLKTREGKAAIDVASGEGARAVLTTFGAVPNQ